MISLHIIFNVKHAMPGKRKINNDTLLMDMSDTQLSLWIKILEKRKKVFAAVVGLLSSTYNWVLPRYRRYCLTGAHHPNKHRPGVGYLAPRQGHGGRNKRLGGRHTGGQEQTPDGEGECTVKWHVALLFIASSDSMFDKRESLAPHPYTGLTASGPRSGSQKAFA